MILEIGSERDERGLKIAGQPDIGGSPGNGGP